MGSARVSEHQFKSDEVPGSVANRKVDRRSLVKAGAILGAAGMVAVGKPVFAQDATPAAEDDVLPGGGQISIDASTNTSDPSLPAVPPEIEEFANDWPMWQADFAATRNAVGSTIDSSNVAELGVAWEFKLGASSPFGAMTSNPVVQGDRIYLIDNTGTMQALNRETGEVIWKVENNVSTLGPNGVAVGYGILIGVLGDTAEVVALNAEDGSEIWRFALSNHNAIGITIAPVIYDGYVIVSTEPGGNTKGTYRGGANGVVYCMDVKTGATLWTWDTVDDDLWGNFRVNSGGGLWYPPSIDLDTGIMFAGVGNAAPFPGTPEFPQGSSRPGPNNYANCLVAIDPKVGKVLWYINVKPFDLYDHDNQQTPVLGTVQMGDSEAKLAFSSGKHGYVVAAHQGSGHEVWRRAVGKHQNDALIELPDEPIEVYPGIQGGVGSPMAFADGVLYVAALNWPNEVTNSTLSADFSKLAEATADLIAIDGATGEYLWQTEIPSGINGPGPTIANDVVFVGSLDGIVRAFNTADGSEVWRSQTSAGLNAPFAIAGDTLLVPAGSFIAASPDSPDPLPAVHTALIAYQLGATGEVTLGEASGETAPVAEDTESLIHVSAIDIAFEQTQISIAADTDVTISVTNNGVLQHDLVIEGTDYATPLLNGGETAELVVNLPAGEYVYYCSISGHRQAGMVGTLTVA
jgi:outer membrane protein assembly factor BamB/plastocyanin